MRTGYAASINYRLRIPNWVAEHLSSADADGEGVDRKHSRFVEDRGVPEAFRATNNDYRGSRLSQGHMAPAGAHRKSQAELNETFLLSDNIVPQEMSNNGSDWLRLERFAKGLTKSHRDVWVVSGPLFLPSEPPDVDHDGGGSLATPGSGAPARRRRVTFDVIGEHGVAVPTHLFKVILAEGRLDGSDDGPRLSAFVLPNGPLRGHPDLDEFVRPLAEVEAASGLLFFEELPDRHKAPPLCGGGGDGGGGRCGVGAMDGRITGWKLLGHLQLANDCKALAAAWDDVQHRSTTSKLDAMPLMRRTYEQMAGSLRCELPVPVPSASGPKEQ